MNEASRVLEEIRRTELEAAREIEEARTNAGEIVEQARDQARRLVEEARERGRRDARRHLEEAIEEAEERGATIRDDGAAEAEQLSKATAGMMEPVIEEMVQVVLAPPAEPGR